MVKSINIYSDEVFYYPWLDHVKVYIKITNEESLFNKELLDTVFLLLQPMFRKTDLSKIKTISRADSTTGDYSLELWFNETTDIDIVVNALANACNEACNTKFTFPDNLKNYEAIYIEHKDVIHILLNTICEKLNKNEYTRYYHLTDGMN